MKKIITITVLFIFSCQSGIEIDTTKYTATDPIADITYLNGSFYTTNIDSSGNAGSQIDLYIFNNESIPINRYPMELNGQGYMAATNDGSNLYFQPRFTDLIFKITPFGEIFPHQSDNFPDNASDTMYWHGRGLAWSDTNLVALYRHKNDSTRYRGRYLHINNNTIQIILDNTVIWDHLNSKGAYAMANNGQGEFIVLATDTLNRNIIFNVDSNFEYDGSFGIINGNPMGISTNPPDIYFSYPERQIELYE